MGMVIKGDVGVGLRFRAAMMEYRTDWSLSCPTVLFDVCQRCKTQRLVRRWCDVLETTDAGGGLVCRGCYLRTNQRGCGDGAVTEGGGAATAAKVP